VTLEEQIKAVEDQKRDLQVRQHASAYVSIRQHTSAYVKAVEDQKRDLQVRQHASAYVTIRQHTSAYISIRQRMSGSDAEGAD
jgi:isocitrate/isopropylmalate dehydrogenase